MAPDSEPSFGWLQEAARLDKEALALLTASGLTLEAVECSEGTANLAPEVGRAERATRLFAAAAPRRDRGGGHLPLIQHEARERRVEALRSTLGPESFAEIWRQGTAMSLSEALRPADDDWQG